MKRIAKFYKVSEKQFVKDLGDHILSSKAKDLYEGIMLPRRATKDSAGYDFFAPFSFTLGPGKSIRIPTGIRARIDEGWVLQIFPRSGLGFKYRVQLDNTVGIIDGDYFNTDNEGHIMIKITNDSKSGSMCCDTVCVEAGTGFAQGIFHEYRITEDDDADEARTGGFGSTTRD